MTLAACSSSPSLEPVAASPGTTAPSAGPAVPTAEVNLRLKRLEVLAVDRLPDVKVALAVVPLATGEVSAIEPDLLVKSASTAKAWWAAAALDAVGVAEVAPLARETFAESSDFTAEEMIHLAGGPDRVNRFTLERAGMTSTGLVQWQGLELQRSTAVAPRLGDSNYTTVRDMVTFLSRLQRGELLDAPETAALVTWMRLSPRGTEGGYGGHLPESLPPDIVPTVAHKAGWLLPYGADPFTLLEIGLVYPAHRDPYAVALMGTTTSEYGPLEAFIAYASCAIYQTVADDPAWRCDDSAVVDPLVGGPSAATAGQGTSR